MTAKAEDRRIQRTRALLLSALLDLIVERGYEDITVQDIVDRANVGRSTFYKHLSRQARAAVERVGRATGLLTQQRAARACPAVVTRTLLGFSLPLFQHVPGELPRSAGRCSARRARQLWSNVIQRILAELVREELAVCVSPGAVLAVPLEVVVQYTVSAFLGLLRWWMDQPTPCSAEEIDRQFRALTIPAIAAHAGATNMSGLSRIAATGQPDFRM